MNEVFKGLVEAWVLKIHRAGWEQGLRHAKKQSSVRWFMPETEKLPTELVTEFVEEVDKLLQPRQEMPERLLTLERQVLRLQAELRVSSNWIDDVRGMLVRGLCDAKGFSELLRTVEKVLEVLPRVERQISEPPDSHLTKMVDELVERSDYKPGMVISLPAGALDHIQLTQPVPNFIPQPPKPEFNLESEFVALAEDWKRVGYKSNESGQGWTAAMADGGVYDALDDLMRNWWAAHKPAEEPVEPVEPVEEPQAAKPERDDSVIYEAWSKVYPLASGIEGAVNKMLYLAIEHTPGPEPDFGSWVRKAESAFGWVVFIYGATEMKDVPEWLQPIYLKAIELRCRLVEFDEGGIIYDEFRTYVW